MKKKIRRKESGTKERGRERKSKQWNALKPSPYSFFPGDISFFYALTGEKIVKKFIFCYFLVVLIYESFKMKIVKHRLLGLYL